MYQQTLGDLSTLFEDVCKAAPKELNNRSVLDEQVARSLTFDDMKRLVCVGVTSSPGKLVIRPSLAPVISYDEAFERDTDLRALLSRQPTRSLIVLWRTSETYGHYICLWLSKKGDDLSIFDSYGDTLPDGWFYHYGAPTGGLSQKLGQDRQYLKEAISRANFRRVYYNDYQIQKKSPNIRTCGRWCVFRLLVPDLSVTQFARLVLNLSEKIDVSCDQLVTLLTEAMMTVFTK
jgi:hypothetical protein